MQKKYLDLIDSYFVNRRVRNYIKRDIANTDTP